METPLRPHCPTWCPWAGSLDFWQCFAPDSPPPVPDSTVSPTPVWRAAWHPAAGLNTPQALTDLENRFSPCRTPSSAPHCPASWTVFRALSPSHSLPLACADCQTLGWLNKVDSAVSGIVQLISLLLPLL